MTSPLTHTEIVRQAREIVEAWRVDPSDDAEYQAVIRIDALLSRADEAASNAPAPAETDQIDNALNVVADQIAASVCPDDARLEIAYAIARHLKLNWPSAYFVDSADPTDDEILDLLEAGEKAKTVTQVDDCLAKLRALFTKRAAPSATPPEAPAALSAPTPAPSGEGLSAALQQLSERAKEHEESTDPDDNQYAFGINDALKIIRTALAATPTLEPVQEGVGEREAYTKGRNAGYSSGWNDAFDAAVQGTK